MIAKVIWMNDSIEQSINKSVNRLISRVHVSFYFIAPHVSNLEECRMCECVTRYTYCPKSKWFAFRSVTVKTS
jgi:hypothetical protein